MLSCSPKNGLFNKYARKLTDWNYVYGNYLMLVGIKICFKGRGCNSWNELICLRIRADHNRG